MTNSLEREERILTRLTTKAEKAQHAADGALEMWLSYNPTSGFSQIKDQELHDSWARKNEIVKRIVIQRDGSAERVEELKG